MRCNAQPGSAFGIFGMGDFAFSGSSPEPFSQGIAHLFDPSKKSIGGCASNAIPAFALKPESDVLEYGIAVFGTADFLLR